MDSHGGPHGARWRVFMLFFSFVLKHLIRACREHQTTFFVLIDYSLRYIPEVMALPLVGPFMKGGVAATVGWAVIWPFENIKNQVRHIQFAQCRSRVGALHSIHIH